MISGRDRSRPSGVGAEEVFEVIVGFVHLGDVCVKISDLLRLRIYGQRNQLRFRNLQTEIKFILNKSLILPAALYGHEGWTMKEVDRKAFGAVDKFWHESRVVSSV